MQWKGVIQENTDQKIAAAFIAHHFKEIGLEPPVNGSYYQPFKMTHLKQDVIYFTASGTKYNNNLRDVLYFGNENTNGEISSDVMFIGKASDSDLAQVDIKGKSVLIWLDTIYLGGGIKFTPIIEKCRKAGCLNVFLVAEKGFDQFTKDIKPFYQTESLLFDSPESKRRSTFIISQGAAEKILNTKIEKLKALASTDPSRKPLNKIKPGTVTISVNQKISEVNTENVLGYLPGSDKKDELLVVTAHYDHIGKQAAGEGDLISNGADDDGSGTVAVMELGRIFAQAKKDGVGPRRSMLFMTFTGEEEGLFGSEYYVKHPVFPLEKTVADLNIDMVGRVDDAHKENKNFVYVIGADRLSSELHEINESKNNLYTHLSFDYTYDDENHPEQLYYRSDHWNFASNDIPIIFYTSGLHADYHRVTDEVRHIAFGPLTLRTQCVFYTAWEIANRDERLRVDKKTGK